MMIQFDEHNFQMGRNHQLVVYSPIFYLRLVSKTTLNMETFPQLFHLSFGRVTCEMPVDLWSFPKGAGGMEGT